MKLFSRFAVLAVLALALTAAFAVTSIAVAEPAAETAAKKKKKKKAVFNSKQKKEINRLIAAQIKKIPAPPAGPAAYKATNGANADLPSGITQYTTVLSKNLPAGKYAVNAVVHGAYVTDQSGEFATLNCRLNVNGTTVATGYDHNEATQFLLVALAARLSTPIVDTIELGAAGTVSIECAASYDNPGAGSGLDIASENAKLTAVTVGSIG